MTLKYLLGAAAAALIGASVSIGMAGDVKKGKKVFNRCKACHTLEKGKKSSLGPNLNGLFGRVSGTLEGFKYSSALKKAEITWDEEKLDTWLTNPKKMVKGSKMNFKVKKESKRADLIAYLKEATK